MGEVIVTLSSEHKTSAAGEAEELFVRGGTEVFFQPVVDLVTGVVAACEISTPMARTASGKNGAPVGEGMPTRLQVLSDPQSAEAALTAAVTAGFAAPFSALVNADTAAVRHLAEHTASVRPVVLVAEHTLLEDPGALIRAVRTLHETGVRVAMNDVGTHPASLALLPLLRPDVVVVDIQVLWRQPDWQRAQTLNAITAYAEEAGAVIIADGITKLADTVKARSFGASYGQGPFFGQPSANVPDPVIMTGIFPGAAVSNSPSADTPYTVAARRRTPRPSTKTLLMHTTRFLETCAFDCDEATLVFACLQENTNLTKKTVDLYAALSRNLSLVVTFVQPVRESTDTLGAIDDLRVRALDGQDPLSNEWVLLILNAKYSVMLAATEIGSTPEGEDAFDYVLTHDRAIVTEAAHALISRL